MISYAISAVHVKRWAWAGSFRRSRPRHAGLNFFVWCFAISGLACVPVALGVGCNPVVRCDCWALEISGASEETNLLVIIDEQNNIDPLRRAMESRLIFC